MYITVYRFMSRIIRGHHSLVYRLQRGQQSLVTISWRVAIVNWPRRQTHIDWLFTINVFVCFYVNKMLIFVPSEDLAHSGDRLSPRGQGRHVLYEQWGGALRDSQKLDWNLALTAKGWGPLAARDGNGSPESTHRAVASGLWNHTDRDLLRL